MKHRKFEVPPANRLSLIIIFVFASFALTILLTDICAATPSAKKPVIPSAQVKYPALVDVGAKKCIPCKMMAPVFAELNGEEDKVKFCKVNVDEQPNLASMFGIDSIPTLAVVQDRHTLTGMVGVHDKADIKAMLEKCKA